MKFFTIITAIIFMAVSMYASAQDKEFDMPLAGISNKGTEFVMTFHPCWEETDPNNFIKIYIFSDVDTKVNVTIPAFNYKKEINVSAYDQTEVELKPSEALMYSKDDMEAPKPEQIWEGRAILIESDDPIICYGMTRFKYTSDGYLGLPTSALGKKYIIASYQDPSNDNGLQYLTSYTSVVAANNQTEVTFTLGGTNETFVPQENSKILLAGESITRIMNKGDVWLIPAMGNFSDLTGSFIESNKPVGVFSGSFCAYVPKGNSACDYLIEQELPIESWGKKYNVPVILNRKYAPIIKIFASEPNTKIYRNEIPLGTISEVGGSPDVGYLHLRMWDNDDEEGNKPAEISGDNPINVTLFNPGQSEDMVLSDPFQMVVSPKEQYSNKFLFSTPGYSGQGFSDNYLAIVYQSQDGTIPSDLLFGEMQFDEFKTKPLNKIYTSEPQVFNEYADDKYYFVTVTLKKDNIYGINSGTPVMAYLYGYDYYDSYGYPAGAILRDLTINDKIEPNSNVTRELEGDVSLTINDIGDDAEVAGIAYVGLLAGESDNYTIELDENFESGDLHTDIKLKVQDKLKDAKAVVYAIDKAGNVYTEEFVHRATSVDSKVTIDGVSIIDIYPSPAVNQANIVINSDKYLNTEIDLSDILGKKILTKNINLNTGRNEISLDMSEYPAGTYFLKLNINGKMLTEKIIK